MTAREQRLNRIVNFACLLAGVGAIVAARFDDGWPWLGIGLILLSASFLIDGLLPGGSDFTPEQKAMLAHAGLPHGPKIGKWLDFGLGIPLLAGGLYTLLSR